MLRISLCYAQDTLTFGTLLSPDYLRRGISQRVSCYALFKGWLLLSQPPHCLWNSTVLSALSRNLGTLDWDSGCSPFDQWSLAPTVWLPANYFRYSEFDWFAEITPCANHPVLYPRKVQRTLSQKIFRREPAITKFDELFTPHHRSSDSFARLNGSGLLRQLRRIHPVHGKITWFRV